MALRKIANDIYSVGVIDWDRRLFDELIPLPDGTSYNSFLVKDKDEALLIDTVDPSKIDLLLQHISECGVKKINYIIAHHAEQDHSGSIGDILERYPDCRIITNKKCKELLIDELHLAEEHFIEIADGDSFDFGQKKFCFIFTPWVHWPETFVTYLPDDQILFTCDFFGSHMATDRLWATGDLLNYRSAKRYYAEIMMPFRKNIQNHLKKLQNHPIKMIAPSHGPLYDKPNFIMDAYHNWISDEVKNEVIVPYVSMHGNTEKAVHYLVEQFIERNIQVTPYNLVKTDIGELAMSLVDCATVIIASPTVLTGPHPLVVYVTYLCNVLRPKIKYAGIVGLFGWGSRIEEEISKLLKNLKVELLPTVLIKSNPNRDDYNHLKQLVNLIEEKHRNLFEQND